MIADACTQCSILLSTTDFMSHIILDLLTHFTCIQCFQGIKARGYYLSAIAITASMSVLLSRLWQHFWTHLILNTRLASWIFPSRNCYINNIRNAVIYLHRYHEGCWLFLNFSAMYISIYEINLFLVYHVLIL